MTEILLLLAPAFCATAIADRVRTDRLTLRGAVYLTAWNAVFANAIVWMVKWCLFHTGEMALFPATGTTAASALKYLAVAVPAAVFAGFAEALLANAFRIEAAGKEDR